MKQLLQNMRNGESSVVELPIPTPQSGEVLVQTAVSLVSAGTERNLVSFAEKSLVGKARSRPDLVRQLVDKARREGLLTTLDAAFNKLDQPLALGYSSAGTIVALGPDVQAFRVGQRVACAGGGYAVHAEFACVPVNLLAALPDTVDFESAAFTTLGAIALHGFRLAQVQIGSRVAVIGLGLLGLLAVSIARAAGCAVLGVDLNPERVKLAITLGAEAVLREQAVPASQAFGRGRGCDAVLICADTRSDDTVELAGEIARDRARVVAIGVVGQGLPRKVYFEKELTFLNSRSYGPGRYDPLYEEAGQDYPVGYVRWTEGRNLEAFVDLLASEQVNLHPLITHRFPIEQAPQAYDLITGKVIQTFLGVLLTYSSEPVNVGALERVNVNTFTHSQVHTLNLGILGAGNFANAVLLPAIKRVEGIELVGIASASGVSAQHAAKRFGIHYAVSDETHILSDAQVNTVAILTRHHLHARQVVAALSAGKHVFCEKPLAINEQELTQVQNILMKKPQPDQAKPLLMVGFNRRFAPLAQQLKAFLDDRKEPLLAHYRVNAGYLPLTHWLHDPAQGGGRIIGEGCHFIDFLTFLVGEPPLTVRATGLPDGGRYREDNVTLTFTFADGSLGMVTYLANGDKSFAKERIELFCAGKVAVLDDYRSLETIVDGRRKQLRSRLRQDKGHQHEWEVFSQAIIQGQAPPIPYNHLIGVTRASFRAVEALRTGEVLHID
jgi:predicted dehydrogenase/threonine dehydrogenase-like Zn-dependent dehydrogenase